MRRRSTIQISILVLCSLGAWSQAKDDGWSKVKDAPSGSELKVYKSDGKPPVMAKFADATDDRLSVVIKNEQTSIPKSDIVRIDYRAPQKGGPKVNQETKYDPTPVDPNAARPSAGPTRTPGPAGTGSSSAGLSFGKGDFELLWRRSGAAK